MARGWPNLPLPASLTLVLLSLHVFSIASTSKLFHKQFLDNLPSGSLCYFFKSDSGQTAFVTADLDFQLDTPGKKEHRL